MCSVKNTASEVGYYGRDEVRLIGHEVYWRKCFREEPDGLALCEETQDNCNVAEVLAIGPKCGTIEQDKRKRERFKWPCGQVFPAKVGDLIILPNESQTMTHPHVRYEGIIHELDIIAILD